MGIEKRPSDGSDSGWSRRLTGLSPGLFASLSADISPRRPWNEARKKQNEKKIKRQSQKD